MRPSLDRGWHFGAISPGIASGDDLVAVIGGAPKKQMSNRPRYRSYSGPRTDVRLVTPDKKLCVAVRRAHSGIVIGRIQATGGNAHSDCWAIFDDPAQFKACCDLDELRFAYPLTFVQLVKEFQDACNQPAPVDPAEGVAADARLLDQGDESH